MPPPFESAPAIRRFLGRFPELREPVEQVLACAARLREAADRAFLPTPGRSVDPELLGALEGAVVELERLAGSSAGQNDADGVTAAIGELAKAVSRMRAERHAFSPTRRTRSPEARRELFGALRAHAESWSRFEAAARRAHVRRIPWQIELATHADPERPVREIEIDGTSIPGVPASRMAWGERALLSAVEWNEDRHPDGPRGGAPEAARFRSLETWHHVLTPATRTRVDRARRALEALRPRAPEAIDALRRAWPILTEGFVGESCSSTFARLGVLDFPSLAVSVHNALVAFGERPFLGRRAADGEGHDGHGYVWSTYEEVRRDALRLARGLEALGLEPGARLGILCRENCREFYLADFAACFSELVSVGLAESLPDARLHSVARRAGVEAVVADAHSAERLLGAPPPDLRALVVFGGQVEGLTGDSGLRIVALEDVLAEELPPGWRAASGLSADLGVLYDDGPGHRFARQAGIELDGDDDVFSILFTSGSTGEPKGTLVSRRRWAEEMCSEIDLWPHVRVSFQPSAVAGDRTLVWRTLASGARVGFARRGAGLWEDVRAIRPTIFSAPPVVWNTLYAEYRRAIADPGLTPPQAAAVRERFEARLGGRVALLAIGGAPSDPGMRRTLEGIFGVRMTESYGTTETGNIAADGRLAEGLDYRLLDVPELGYRAAEGRGELAVRTPRTTTASLGGDSGEYTEDGYFRTGDLVEIGEGRRLKVLGRRKQFFKLAGSEFVSPASLEAVYRESELVEEVLVTGSALHERVVAVAVGCGPEVGKAEVLADFRRLARREGLRASETPAGVIVVPRTDDAHPWTVENGLLTATSKPNRRALEDRYAGEVDALYARLGETGITEGAEAGATSATADRALDRVVRIAAAVLGRPPADVDATRTFLELGGDSLSGMDFVLRLEEVFEGKGERLGVGDRPRDWVETPLGEAARSLAGIPSSAPRQDVAASSEDSPVRPEPRPTPEAATAPEAPEAEPSGEEEGPERSAARAEADLANADASRAFELPEPLPERSEGSDVLLTGGTGFLGVHLLAELGRSLPPDARLIALVRADDDAGARRRLEGALERAALGAAVLERVDARAGSLEEERFGLSPEVWDRLTRSVGLIHHVAARVDFSLRYGDLRRANVDGVRRVLRFATTGRTKALHFVSSLNVAFLIARSSGGKAYEESPLPEALGERDVEASLGYTVSKWAAERTVQRAWAASGGALPISISRPAMVSWSTATGFANEDDWLTRMLDSCLVLRQAIGPDLSAVPRWVRETPTSTRGFDLVPVDFVASALRHLGEATRTGALPEPTRPSPPLAPTFHVSCVTGSTTGLVTLSHLMDRLVASETALGVHDLGREPMGFLPFSQWATRVEVEEAPAVAVLDQLRRTPPMERTEARRFAAALARMPLEGARFDRALAEAFVRGRRDRRLGTAD